MLDEMGGGLDVLRTSPGAPTSGGDSSSGLLGKLSFMLLRSPVLSHPVSIPPVWQTTHPLTLHVQGHSGTAPLISRSNFTKES